MAHLSCCVAAALVLKGRAATFADGKQSGLTTRRHNLFGESLAWLEHQAHIMFARQYLDAQMPRIRNEPAYIQAIREWGVPDCLHVPIVAVDEQAVTDHIGDIIEVISPGRALLVEIDDPPPRDNRLPIWAHPLSCVFFEKRQVWVSPSYSRYRYAYAKALGRDSVEGRVLAHMYNRRTATLRGYNYIRIVPVSRGANSSSSVTEQWGVERSATDLGARRERMGLRMQYADLGDLMVMLDIQLGGGIQEVFRVGQDLIEVPGVRTPQASA